MHMSTHSGATKHGDSSVIGRGQELRAARPTEARTFPPQGYTFFTTPGNEPSGIRMTAAGAVATDTFTSSRRSRDTLRRDANRPHREAASLRARAHS